MTGTPTTPIASNVSGSDLESPEPKLERNAIPVSGGKVSKRKSRASKRSRTTFITADPANFRQMVQQVTGVRFGNAQLPLPPVLKREPQRPGSQLTGAGTGGFLPALDSSAFLLDHHQQNFPIGPSVSVVCFGPGPLDFQSSVASNGAELDSKYG